MNEWNGPVILASPSSICSPVDVLIMNGVVDLGPFELTVTGSRDTRMGNAVVGTGSLVKRGTGELRLFGTGDLHGYYDHRLGRGANRQVVREGHPDAPTKVAAAGSLTINGDLTLDEPLTLSGNGHFGVGALQIRDGHSIWQGDITPAADSRMMVIDGGQLTLSGTVQGPGRAGEIRWAGCSLPRPPPMPDSRDPWRYARTDAARQARSLQPDDDLGGSNGHDDQASDAFQFNPCYPGRCRGAVGWRAAGTLQWSRAALCAGFRRQRQHSLLQPLLAAFTSMARAARILSR